ncbi:MAG: hypothetical protein RG740_01925 [Acholeplasmataceae bacterium]|nr:hypothetical protein [Acholeplasmataceae bacterium]
MKILMNFKEKKERVEEFSHVSLLVDREVFVDLPICAVDFGRHYDKPVLYGNYNGIPTVYEEAEVIKHLETLKVFHLKNDKGKLTEVSKEDADISIRLPKDTNVDQLVYDNGQVFWAKPVEGKEAETDGNN